MKKVTPLPNTHALDKKAYYREMFLPRVELPK